MDFQLIDVNGDAKAYLENLREAIPGSTDEEIHEEFGGFWAVHFGLHPEDQECFEPIDSYYFYTEDEALEWIDWRFYEFCHACGIKDEEWEGDF